MINENEIRVLVREAVRRQITAGGPASAGPAEWDHRSHPSHLLLPVHPGSAIETGACLIEPAVACTHCGYCQSFGH
jgi:hypothetical protein